MAHNLHILERDKISFAKGKKYFPSNNHLLVPDTVTAMELPNTLQNNKRAGVCFFLRNDKEKVLPDDIVAKLRQYLDLQGIKYEFSDTVIPDMLDNNSARWKAVTEKLQMARNSRLVITDRYHGTIFSVITHTPVVVFKSYDTKISAGIKWFEDLSWVHYAENMNVDEIIMLIKRYCSNEKIAIKEHSDCGARVLNAIKCVKES